MGRRKAKIEAIVDTKSKRTTFIKRGMVVLKKAMELSIMCQCKVALVIVSPHGAGRLTDYCSTGNMEEFLWDYLDRAQQPRGSDKLLSNVHYPQLWPDEKSNKASSLFRANTSSSSSSSSSSSFTSRACDSASSDDDNDDD